MKKLSLVFIFYVLTPLIGFTSELTHIKCDAFVPAMLKSSIGAAIYPYEFYIDDVNQKLLDQNKNEWGTKNYSFDENLIQVERIRDYTYMFVIIDRLNGSFQMATRGIRSTPTPNIGTCVNLETNQTKF